MNRLKNILLLAIIAISTPAALAADRVEIGDSQIRMTYEPTGKISSIAGNFEKSISSTEPSGFVAVIDSKEVQLEPQSYKKSLLTLSGGGVTILLDINEQASYTTYRVRSVEESSEGLLEQIRFYSPVDKRLAIFPLDWMTKQNGRRTLSVEMPWIWWRDGVNPLGAFALFSFNSDKEHDDNLMKLWVKEGLPHPKIEGEWSEKRARQHLAVWQEKFTDQSAMIVQPDSFESLIRLTDFANEQQMKKIYLHTDTWRGEYWPMKHSFLSVNPKIFPNGVPDFQKFADYCKSLGMELAIHTVSCSIARNDPDYALEGLHPDLSTWAKGELVEPISKDAKVIKFRPAEGVVYPTPIGHAWQGPNSIPQFMHTNLFQIGNEVIRAGGVTDTHNDVWTLQNCIRGYYDTKAADHGVEDYMRGLYSAYGQVFVADPDSELVDELVARYGDFCNRNGVTHIECDALEIYRSKPWGSNKFSWKVYSSIDHPVTSNTSGGAPLGYQIEYWFKGSDKVKVNHNSGGVAGGNGMPIILELQDRVATNPYEVMLKPSHRLSTGGKTFNLMRPIPMFGLSEQVLSSYGLTSYITDLLSLYREAAANITPSQSRDLSKSFVPYETPYGEARNHQAAKYLYRPERSEKGVSLTPLQLIAQPRYNMTWGWGQESGPIVPWQYMELNKSVNVVNPMKAQTPELLLRVMNELVEMTDKSSANSGKEDGSAVIDSYLTGAGASEMSHPLAGAKHIEVGQEESARVARKSFYVTDHRDITRLDFVFQSKYPLSVFFNGAKIYSGGAVDKAITVDMMMHKKEAENILTVEMNGSGGLVAAIISEEQGVRHIIQSDDSWLTTTTPTAGWKSAGYDASAWVPMKEISEYGSGLYQRSAVTAQTRAANLMPKGEEEIVLQSNNPAASRKVTRGADKSWRVDASMSKARGLAVTVVGDGSNSTLVVRLFGRGAREYVVPIDFTGQREIIIPNGEMSWSDVNNGLMHDTKYMNYGGVVNASVRLGIVPPKTDAKVTVKGIRMLEECEAVVSNLTIKSKSGSLRVMGDLKSGEYVWYRGGESADIYDSNYKLLRSVECVNKNFVMPSGESTISISGKSSAKGNVSLQYLLMAKGESIEIKTR